MELLDVYKYTAIVSGVIFLLQLGATLIGFDHDTGHDGGFDHGGGDHDGDAGHGFGFSVFSFLSVRNVVCFLLAFSVTGYFSIRSYGFGNFSVIPGLLAGMGLVMFNIFLMRSMSRLKRDTSVRPEEFAGHDGLVVFTILKSRSGQGKVDVNMNGRYMTLFALTDETEDIPRNSRIVIDQVLEGWILLVRRK